MIDFSFCLVFMIVFQTGASLNFTCKDVQNHKNYHLLTSPAKCMPVKPSTRIMGGTDARLGEFPWMAILFINGRAYVLESQVPDIKYKKPFCDGTIISSKYVLTAAHCLTDDKFKLGFVTIRVGEYDLDKVKSCNGSKCSTAKEYAIESHLIHLNYDNREGSNKKNDIGLARVKGEIIFNEFVYPACLPTSCNLMKEHFVGKLATVAGWGNLADIPNVVPSPILQKVEMPVVELSVCAELYGIHFEESQLCVGGSKSGKPWKDACSGDSGGPIVYPSPLDGPSEVGKEYYVQIGIVSMGPSCEPDSEEQPFGIYTKVASYLLWILDNISV